LPAIEADADRGKVEPFLRSAAGDIQAVLHARGAVLLTGLPLESVKDFVAVRDALLPETTPYVEAATPRMDVGQGVFTSTEFPASEEIALHNENSYARTWPGYLVFGCLVPPESRGATTVADVRRVLARIPQEVLEPFRANGWMLQRTYLPGFGLSWQTAFGTEDPVEVARYCDAGDLEYEWLDGTVLRTRQVRPAFVRHPETGEESWFNHVRFWHPSMLSDDVRELLIEEYGEQALPYRTCYGEGTPIPDADVRLIAEAYEAEKLAPTWRPGTVLLVDNMLAAHGREPYTGTRRIVVSMGVTRRAEAG
jgi:alpha-ketoglutarate-dependent taurine dioxygenase